MTVAYVDTSALVAIAFGEPGGAALGRRLGTFSVLLSSNLLEAELRAAYSRIEDRYGIRSTVVTSQLPVEKWHDAIADPTLADAILDRLVHSAYQLNLKGESMRKRHRPLTQTGHRDS